MARSSRRRWVTAGLALLAVAAVLAGVVAVAGAVDPEPPVVTVPGSGRALAPSAPGEPAAPGAPGEPSGSEGGSGSTSGTTTIPGQITHGDQLRLEMVGPRVANPEQLGSIHHTEGERTISDAVITSGDRQIVSVSGGTLILDHCRIEGLAADRIGALVDGGTLILRRCELTNVGIGLYGVAGRAVMEESVVHNIWGEGVSHNEAVKAVVYAGELDMEVYRSRLDSVFRPDSTGGGMSAAMHVEVDQDSRPGGERCHVGVYSSYANAKPSHSTISLHWTRDCRGEAVDNVTTAAIVADVGASVVRVDNRTA